MRGEWVTRLRAPGVADPYSGGDDAPDWANPAELKICTRVPAEPRPTSEATPAGREAVTSGFRLYLRPGTDVVTTDRLRVRGEVFRVDGEPALWAGSCLVVDVTKVEG